jgi:hypothetical protein
VRVGSIQGETLGASVVLAATVLVAAALAGHAALGAGVGVGLVLGSFNGFIIQALLERRAPMLATSVLRLAFFSVLALIAARFAGGSVWPVVIGIGIAQLVMVGVGVRRGLRA